MKKATKIKRRKEKFFRRFDLFFLASNFLP